MTDSLVLTLVTDEKVFLVVDNGMDALSKLYAGEPPYDREWIQVDEEQLIRCDSIVMARVAASPGGPLVAIE
jgi:hypothetical protein